MAGDWLWGERGCVWVLEVVWAGGMPCWAWFGSMVGVERFPARARRGEMGLAWQKESDLAMFWKRKEETNPQSAEGAGGKGDGKGGSNGTAGGAGGGGGKRGRVGVALKQGGQVLRAGPDAARGDELRVRDEHVDSRAAV